MKAQPEVRPSPNFYDFGKPEARPIPNIRPVGYPTGLNHQKLHPIPPKKSNLIIYVYYVPIVPRIGSIKN